MSTVKSFDIYGKTYEERERIVASTCELYRLAKFRVAVRSRMKGGPNDDDASSRDQDLINLIDSICGSCTPETAEIIREVYLKQDSEIGWQLGYFAKSTYYRKRRKAVDEFYEKMFLF